MRALRTAPPSQRPIYRPEVSVPISLPPRAIAAEAIADWSGEVLVPYCGTFQVERTFGHLRFHSADASLYSAALGACFLDQPLPPLTVTQPERFGWVADSLTDPLETAAALTALHGATGQPNPYSDRILSAVRQQWPGLMKKARASLSSLHPPLASFHSGDSTDWLSAQDDRPVILFWPTGSFGADYAAGLEDVFLWPAHQKPALADLVPLVTARPRWLAILSEPADLPAVGQTQGTPIAPPLYLYGSADVRRLVRPRQATEPVLIPRLAPGSRTIGPVELRRLTTPQFNALRSRYLNAHIAPGAPRFAVAVTVGGALVGAYALRDMDPRKKVAGLPDPALFLLTDFPVAPGPRGLAKLVLLAALSRESQLLAEGIVGHRIRGLVTTVYSDRPVSMKYRGLFDLHARKETPEARMRYMLNYHAALGEWTLADVLARWAA